MRLARVWVMGFAILIGIGTEPSGHTPIASRWNYNEHLFPIFRDRCGSCHIEGGVAPMSLVEYKAAFPWAQAIREEVLGLRMPPWQAEDGFGDFKNGHALAAAEMDKILEWSSGGYPQGPRTKSPEPAVLADDWTLGTPTITLEPLEAFTLTADTAEAVRYFVIPSGIDDDSIVTGVEFRPGAPSVVRGAAVFFDATGTAQRLDAADPGPGFAGTAGNEFPADPAVAVWTPGQPSVLNAEVGYPLTGGADIVVRVHYRKTWITEGTEFTDRSRLGLHLAEGEAAGLQSALFSSPMEIAGREVTFTHVVEQDSTLVSLLPEVDIESSDLQIEAVRPDGSREPLLWLREPDSGWPTRFWFDKPVELPAGSHLEVTARLDPAAERRSSETLLGDARAPIRFSVDYVAGQLKAGN